jgi:GH25 family lysozyme M1 (1,4-beta-N-acetylmuramidase)
MRRPARLLGPLLVATVLAAGLPLATPAAAAGLPVGPDVSSWQHPSGAAIDWAKVRAGGSLFTIIKATEGTGYVNPYYASDAQAARANHLAVGAYAFVRPALPISTATSQAQQFVNTIGSQASTGTLPPVMDLETTGGLGPADLITWSQQFLETVRSLTGRTPIVYSYPYFWPSSMGNTTALGRYPLWLASYQSTSPSPLAGWSSWTLWQYTSSATVAGIPGSTGSTDMSQFNGTTTQLAALANGTVATPWSVTAPSAPVSVSATPGQASATVRWLPANDGGQVPSRYTVTASPGGATVAVSGTAYQASFSGLTGGTAYTFTVRATNTAGTSAASAATAPVVAGQLPSPPGRPVVTTSSGRVALQWAASSGAPTSYAVLRCSPAPCSATSGTVATVAAPTTSWTDTSVVNGTTYGYAVVARNSYGVSGSSGTVAAAPVGPPSSPTALTTSTTPSSITVTWSPPASNGGSAVTGYVVTLDGTTRTTLSADSLSATLSSLASASTHTVTVVATSALGTGPAAAVTVTTPAAPNTVTAPVASAVVLTLPRYSTGSGRALPVTVQALQSGTGAPLAGATVVVSTTSFTALVTGTVTASLPATARSTAASAAGVVNVLPIVTAYLTTYTAKVGQSVAMVGSVSPLLAGVRVYRQGYYSGGWHTYASTLVDRYGHYRFLFAPTVATTDHYRVWVGVTWLNVGGPSRTVDLRVL